MRKVTEFLGLGKGKTKKNTTKKTAQLPVTSPTSSTTLLTTPAPNYQATATASTANPSYNHSLLLKEIEQKRADIIHLFPVDTLPSDPVTGFSESAIQCKFDASHDALLSAQKSMTSSNPKTQQFAINLHRFALKLEITIKANVLGADVFAPCLEMLGKKIQEEKDRRDLAKTQTALDQAKEAMKDNAQRVLIINRGNEQGLQDDFNDLNKHAQSFAQRGSFLNTGGSNSSKHKTINPDKTTKSKTSEQDEDSDDENKGCCACFGRRR